MANKVTFTNTSGQVLMVEAGKKDNLVDIYPKYFQNGFDEDPKLGLIDVYGSMYVNGDTSKKPVTYFRHVDVATGKYRIGSLLEAGDTYLDHQKGVLHHEELALRGDPITNNYHQLEGEKIRYGFDSNDAEKKVEVIFDEDEISVKEGDFFELKAYPWPVTFYDHQSVYLNSSTIFQPCTFLGKLDGRPVAGLGSVDRMAFKKAAGGFSSVPMGYIAISGMGIRKDGRKESVFVSASMNSVGKTLAIYYLEGETPVISDTVTIEADWVKLPYVDDGTCTFKDAAVYIGDKVIHYQGKWGSKGFTHEPNIEKHGQSQVFGTWYEGDTPYEHRLSYTFSESMEAYEHVLKDLGFNVYESLD